MSESDKIIVSPRSQLSKEADLIVPICESWDSYLTLCLKITRKIDIQSSVLSRLNKRTLEELAPSIRQAVIQLSTAVEVDSKKIGIINDNNKVYYRTYNVVKTVFKETLLARILGALSILPSIAGGTPPANRKQDLESSNELSYSEGYDDDEGNGGALADPGQKDVDMIIGGNSYLEIDLASNTCEIVRIKDKKIITRRPFIMESLLPHLNDTRYAVSSSTAAPIPLSDKKKYIQRLMDKKKKII